MKLPFKHTSFAQKIIGIDLLHRFPSNAATAPQACWGATQLKRRKWVPSTSFVTQWQHLNQRFYALLLQFFCVAIHRFHQLLAQSNGNLICSGRNPSLHRILSCHDQYSLHPFSQFATTMQEQPFVGIQCTVIRKSQGQGKLRGYHHFLWEISSLEKLVFFGVREKLLQSPNFSSHSKYTHKLSH